MKSFIDIKTLRELIRSKKVSVEEVRHFYNDRIIKYDDQIGATLETFTHHDTPVNPDAPLYGIPGFVKDNICQQGRITSCASKMLEHFVSPYDATCVERLKQAGAYSLGRANCDEFAMGSSTETSAFKKTFNPWDLGCVPGGSSGGSAAAVAAGMAPWALGTDTGGSVRQPAGFCGIVGMKPTYGLVPRYGLVAYASSLDVVGLFTRTVYDNALVLSQMTGPDGKDSTALQDVKKIDYTQALTGKIKPGMKIGIVANAVNAEGIDAGVRQALDEAIKSFESMGATIVSVTLPAMDHGAAVYFMLSRAEAASNLARFDGIRYGTRVQADDLLDVYEESRANGFGAEVKRRIMIGNYVLSAGHADAYYKSAKTVQAMMRQEFLDAFKHVDLLFIPTAPCPAFKFGAFKDNPLKMDLQDYFTAPINLTGLPGISIPCGFVDGMPIGMQLIGPDQSEELILQTAHAYEQMHGWHLKHPEWLV
jgi:aspartyl-tRNA(Asn)/glutamyl-tRNA(Gln) amidotransferase subunit A